MKTKLELYLTTDTVRKLASARTDRHPSMELSVFIEYLLIEALKLEAGRVEQ
jgi:superfamily I DNA/RNA helicase